MPHHGIKAILFDKDGTLLKFNETWLPVIETSAMEATGGNETRALELMQLGGYDPRTRDFNAGSILGAGNTEEIADLWLDASTLSSRSALIDLLDCRFAKAMFNAVPIDGLEGTIRTFHDNGYVLGLASSDSEAAIKVFLQQMGLIDLFDFVVGYDSGFGHKPDPGMFDGFCQHISFDPFQVAMVGDNPQDMQMAKSANSGLKVGVLSGNSSADELHPHADHILDDISDLPGLLLHRA